MLEGSEIRLYSGKELDDIRKAASMAAEVRDIVADHVAPGVSTLELTQLAHSLIKKMGAVPTFLGYSGFPAPICISVNYEVVHGTGKADKLLFNGDVVSIDVGVTYNGFIGDTAKTVIAGEVLAKEDLFLINTTEKALYAGIKFAKAGNCVNDISLAIGKIAKEASLSIVKEYVGHGCGKMLHEQPEIPNYDTNEPGVELLPGMVLCIEPVFYAGFGGVYTDYDGWTVIVKDGSNSAHFEHMVLVTENDPEILSWQKM